MNYLTCKSSYMVKNMDFRHLGSYLSSTYLLWDFGQIIFLSLSTMEIFIFISQAYFKDGMRVNGKYT